MANILTIAGSDPCGQAGLQADLEVIHLLGHRGFSVITAVTAQNDERVYSVNPVDTRVLKDQLRSLLSKYSFDAVKVGLLVTNELAYQVFRVLGEAKLPNLVIDPIMASSSGAVLLESAAISVLTGYLFPLARLVTPNLDEAETLAGMTVRNLEQMAQAAKKIANLVGIESVLIKGGHLEGEKTDVLFDEDTIHEFPGGASLPEHMRGTGCRLSSAITCYLAEGSSVQEAVQKGKSFLEEFIPKQSR